MCVLRFVQDSAGLSSPAPSPAPSPAAASGFCCHACHVLLHGNVFCDCGHRELHQLLTSPPRWWIRPQLFDTAVHGVDELTERLSPVAASGRHANGSRRRAVCARRHLSLASSSSRAHRCAPAPTTHGVSVPCMTEKCATNTWDEKHDKQELQAMASPDKQDLQAVASATKKCYKQWRYQTKNTSKRYPTKIQAMASPDWKVMRHDQICGSTSERVQPAAAAATHQLVMRVTTTKTEQQVCLDQWRCVLCDDSHKVALASARARPVPGRRR